MSSRPDPTDVSAESADYSAPEIVALGDVNTDTLQTGIPG